MVASSLSSNRDRHRHIDGCTGNNLHIKPRLHNVLVSNRRVRVMELPCSLLVAVGCTDLRYHRQYDWNKFSDEQFFLSGITENPYVSGSSGAKRWLTPGATPPGWHSPGPPCTITNSRGQVVAAFVEIDGVGRAFWNYNDCRTSYDTINGGTPLPGGVGWCDSYGNLFDPAVVPNYSTSCTTASDPTCYGRIHVEIDGDWLAAGYCGPGTACDNNTLVKQTVQNSATTLIDIQGYVFWDKDHVADQWHQFSGWELHPLTAWRLHNSTPPLATSFTYAPTTPTTGQSVTFTSSTSGGTTPYTYSWNFGDGATGTGSSTAHTYSS